METMRSPMLFCLIAGIALASAADAPVAAPPETEVVRVRTALGHLTVLEFGEPVALVAVGGSSFQIERHEDKVFIKPLESGTATDLIVWTRSRRFIYELEAPGEVKDMNFLLDSRAA